MSQTNIPFIVEGAKYKHYKGGIYMVDAVALLVGKEYPDSGVLSVIYHIDYSPSVLYVRTKEEFTEMMVNGVRRFELLQPQGDTNGS